MVGTPNDIIRVMGRWAEHSFGFGGVPRVHTAGHVLKGWASFGFKCISRSANVYVSEFDKENRTIDEFRGSFDRGTHFAPSMDIRGSDLS